MSEERITKVEVEKDSRRVAAGKKLAEYNKVKREKKQADEEVTKESRQCGGTNTMTIILTGVGIIAGLDCLYLKYKQDKREENTEETEKKEDNAPAAVKTQRSNHLRSLDD